MSFREYLNECKQVKLSIIAKKLRSKNSEEDIVKMIKNHEGPIENNGYTTTKNYPNGVEVFTDNEENYPNGVEVFTDNEEIGSILFGYR